MRPVVLFLLSGCLVNPGLRDERIDQLTCDDATEGTPWFADGDDDGFGRADDKQLACEQPPGFSAESGDCDDEERAVNPAAPEVCDGVDNDCDGEVDVGAVDAVAWYRDEDGDGFGDDASELLGCDGPPDPSWIGTGGDCDDLDPSKSPGLPELCDGFDNDCDGTVDEGDALDAEVFYADQDGDDFGDPGAPLSACVQPSDYVYDDQDCDDGNPEAHPGGVDVVLQDRDCDGVNADLTFADAELYGRPDDRVGLALAAVGDVNDDGLADFAAGMPGNDPVYGLGATVVVLGGSRQRNGALAYAGPTWTGEDPGDDAGGMVAGGADVDGDGVQDLLMGSPGQAGGRGSVYLAPGGAGFGGGSLLSMPEIKGQASERFGTAGALGDLDGDGLAELVVGAPSADDEGIDGGGIYLLGGAPSFPINSDVAALGTKLTGPSGSESGAAVAVADLDGDGRLDVVVGAPGDGSVGNRSGAVFVLAGTGSLPSGSLAGMATVLSGDGGRDQAGIAVAGPGDVDGDGYADLLVGAPGHLGDDGAAYLVRGAAAGVSGGGLGLADTVFTGQGGQRLGTSVAGAGDVDGDGQPDLVLGAPEGGASHGEAWLVLGGTALPAQVDASGVDVVIRGEIAGDTAGNLVIGVGDADGDGYGELVIAGGGHRHNGTPSSGAVYLVYGMPL